MKKIVLTLLFGTLTLLSTAQTLVHGAPVPKNVLIEEFTGIYCPNCPAGHQEAKAIENLYPGRIVIVNLHTTDTYSKPQSGSGHPDFRTGYSSALNSLGSPVGIPCAMINRTTFESYKPTGGGIAIFANNWRAAVGEIINAEDAPINIGAASTFNSGTRELLVDVEVLFREAQTTYPRIFLYFEESGMTGYQSSGGTNYPHDNVMRTMISGSAGTLIQKLEAGSFYSKQYTYTVPAGYDIANCKVIAFVAAGSKEVYQAIELSADGGTTLGTAEESKNLIHHLNIYPNPVQDQATLQFVLNDTKEVNIEIYNALGALVQKENLGTLGVGVHTSSIQPTGEAAAKGFYLMKLTAGDQIFTSNFIVN